MARRLDEERWVPIPDWPYEVSDHGQVRRSAGGPATHAGRTLQATPDRIGYWRLKLCDGPRIQKFMLHRLVANAFVPGYTTGLQVNHRDGNKANNAAENLEWVTAKENRRHAIETGLVRVDGEHHPKAKITEQDVRDIRRRYSEGGETHRSLGAEYGLHFSTIRKIVLRQYWSKVA